MHKVGNNEIDSNTDHIWQGLLCLFMCNMYVYVCTVSFPSFPLTLSLTNQEPRSSIWYEFMFCQVPFQYNHHCMCLTIAVIYMLFFYQTISESNSYVLYHDVVIIWWVNLSHSLSLFTEKCVHRNFLQNP